MRLPVCRRRDRGRAGRPRGSSDHECRRERATGAVQVLTRRPGGATAGGNHSTPVLSADGQVAGFVSNSTTLTAADRTPDFDAFIRDVGAGRTELASSGNGDAGVVALPADGRWVAFTSTATDLVPGSVFPNRDVHLRDRTTGSGRQVTVRSDGSFPPGPGRARWR